MNVLEGMDNISKYIVHKRNDVYVPVVMKNEWDGHANAYWAYYAKVTKHGLSTKKMLFAVCDSSLKKTLKKFVRLHCDYEAEGWIRHFEGAMTWFGPAPHTWNFMESKHDHSLIE